MRRVVAVCALGGFLTCMVVGLFSTRSVVTVLAVASGWAVLFAALGAVIALALRALVSEARAPELAQEEATAEQGLDREEEFFERVLGLMGEDPEVVRAAQATMERGVGGPTGADDAAAGRGVAAGTSNGGNEEEGTRARRTERVE